MRSPLFWLLPLLLFFLIAPFTPYLDLSLSSHFYEGDRIFYNNSILQFFFVWGERFGLAFGIFACFVWGLSYIYRPWKKWRKTAQSFVLTLVLGAGILVNSVFKEYWGRPRPKQVIEFGGKYPYRPFWKPYWAPQEPMKSFPSGHVAMGACFFSLILSGSRSRKHHAALFWTGCAFSLFWAGGAVITRIAQGGHFLSDTLASLVLMWLVALTVDYFVFTWGEGGRTKGNSRRRALGDSSRESDAP